ncbi:MAG TPA: DUF5318 family protein [Acidimicrobiales bacterium]|nr:DUF5318 family protein [Acidimicrobiales bacterium]
MVFRPETAPAAAGPQPPGGIDYRLARNAVVRAFNRGRLSRADICDAHPELLRVAQNFGQPSAEACPICSGSSLVNVSYAFGPRLPPGGRCVESSEQLANLAARAARLACYVVEVCPDCSWNHLRQMFVVGGSSPS